jgi:hypothetical protein
VTHIRYPYAYRGCSGGAQEEEAFSLGCARYIEEKLFKTILAPEEVAAIFIEPIQGEGGYVVAPDNFLRELRAFATGTAFCWWWTRCSAAPGARASGGPSSTPAWSRTWSAWPRASPAACRWASA